MHFTVKHLLHARVSVINGLPLNYKSTLSGRFCDNGGRLLKIPVDMMVSCAGEALEEGDSLPSSVVIL